MSFKQKLPIDEEINRGKEIFERIMEYKGKRRNQVSSPGLTANEAIWLAEYISNEFTIKKT